MGKLHLWQVNRRGRRRGGGVARSILHQTLAFLLEFKLMYLLYIYPRKWEVFVNLLHGKSEFPPILAVGEGGKLRAGGSVLYQTPQFFLEFKLIYLPYICPTEREVSANLLDGKSDFLLVLTEGRGKG